ncbi:type III pantothenate kinase [Mycoplasmopsis citelli]
MKQILENDLKITNIKIINHNYPFDVKTVIQKEKIGLDIIASASYANSLTNDSFVFMFGSASVAIQILNKTISGVSIAPGIGFSFYKLQKHLKKSSSGNATWNYPVTFSAQMGTNTLKALNSGLYKMFLGYIVSHLVLQNKVIKDIFITGGDVNLKAHLQKELRLIFPHLKVHIVNSMVALGFAQVINKK